MTLGQTLKEEIFRQIDPDEHHFAHSLLARCPFGSQIAAHELVDALKNDLVIGAFHVQNTFVAQHAGSVDVHDGPQEILQLGRVQ